MKFLLRYCFLLMLSAPVFCFSQANVFQKVYGDTIGDDVVTAVIVNTTGEIIATGGSDNFAANDVDALLMKLDENGNTLWAKTYGGTIDDDGACIEETPDGGYMVAGATGNFGAGGSDIYAIRTDANGDTLWTRTYGGINAEGTYGAAITADNGFIITGVTTTFGAGMKDVYLIRIDSLGNLLWTKTYGGADDDEGLCVRQTPDGGFIVSGYTFSFGAGSGDVYLIKTDGNGDTLWTKTYGGSMTEFGEYVRQTFDGGYIITGTTGSFGAAPPNIYLIKTNSTGDTLWTKTYGASFPDFGYSVLQTINGGYAVVGMMQRNSNLDVYLIRINSDGDTLWTKAYGGTSDDRGYSIQQHTDGFVIMGLSYSFQVFSNRSIYLIKTDAWGNSGGCNEYQPNTVVSSTNTIIGSGAIVGSGGVANNTNTIVTDVTPLDTTLCFAVGVEDASTSLSMTGVRVYPNPSDGKFTFEISNNEQRMMNVEVSIYDVLGRKVRELEVRSEKAVIKRNGLESGVYIYKASSEQGLLGAGKIIIN